MWRWQDLNIGTEYLYFKYKLILSCIVLLYCVTPLTVGDWGIPKPVRRSSLLNIQPLEAYDGHHAPSEDPFGSSQREQDI